MFFSDARPIQVLVAFQGECNEINKQNEERNQRNVTQRPTNIRCNILPCLSFQSFYCTLHISFLTLFIYFIRCTDLSSMWVSKANYNRINLVLPMSCKKRVEFYFISFFFLVIIKSCNNFTRNYYWIYLSLLFPRKLRWNFFFYKK